MLLLLVLCGTVRISSKQAKATTTTQETTEKSDIDNTLKTPILQQYWLEI